MRYWACYYDLEGVWPDYSEYFEVDENDAVTRQVYILPHAVVTSRVDEDPLIGPTLADQPFSYLDKEGLVEISQEEFEIAWNRPDQRRRWRALAARWIGRIVSMSGKS